MIDHEWPVQPRKENQCVAFLFWFLALTLLLWDHSSKRLALKLRSIDIEIQFPADGK
jgi:hypothetical protein